MRAKTQRSPARPSNRTHAGIPPGTWERAVLGCGVSWALCELYHSSLGATRCLTVAPPAPSCNPQKCLNNKELTPGGEPLFKREAKASQMLSVLCNKKKRRPHTGQPPWSAAATQEAGQSGDAEPPCSVKAHHCRVRQDFWFRMPPALPQRHPPPQRALSAQATRLPCLQALLTGSPLLAPRPATCIHSSWLVLDHRWAPLQPRRAPTPSSQSPQDPGALPVTAPSPAGGPVSTPSHAAGRHPPRDRTQVAAFENRAVGTCKRRLNRGPEWLNSVAFKAGKAIRKS